MHIYVGSLTLTKEVRVECVKLLVRSVKAKGSIGKAPLINLGLRCRQVTILSLRPHYAGGKSLHYPLYRKLERGRGGTRACTGVLEKRKIYYASQEFNTNLERIA